MTPQEMAAMLNGRQYREELTTDEEKQAKDDGLVIIFGQSDDNMAICGAIRDEVGCYNGGTAYLTKDDLFDENSCEDENCPYKANARDLCKKIEAKWAEDGYSWTYETDIPHETFEIMEDEDKYCRGIVFHISSLQ